MKNKLIDLNDHLFSALERLGNEKMSSEQIENEIRRSKALVSVGQAIIQNGRLALEAQQHVDAMNPDAIAGSSKLPEMLESTPRRLDA